jgi:hypothetical protein
MQKSGHKPSKKFFAKAMPTRGGYHAQFAAPGLVPGFVMDGDQRELFDTEQDAEFAAHKVLVKVLQSRLDRPEIRSSYQTTTAMEFSELIDEADITAQHYSWVTGAKPKTVQGWLDGSLAIPHHTYLLAKLCTVHLEEMEEITENRVIE